MQGGSEARAAPDDVFSLALPMIYPSSLNLTSHPRECCSQLYLCISASDMPSSTRDSVPIEKPASQSAPHVCSICSDQLPYSMYVPSLSAYSR